LAELALDVVTVASVSSTTSCSRPAHTLAASSFRSVMMPATVRGVHEVRVAALSLLPLVGALGELVGLFFGGGTPSLWEPRELGRTLRAIIGAFSRRAADLEVTVECNPSSLDERRAAELLEQGVNRLSVGLQSLDPARLTFLGRLHDAEGGLAALAAARRAGFVRVSGDLIFGVEGGRPQSAEAAAAEAGRVADAGVTHVSAYGLTIESGTLFGELHRKGRLPVATDDVIVDSFFAIESALAARGLGHYEISNYAVPGDEARHNVGYWRGDDYLGLGCAAVGTLSRPDGSALRVKNHPDPGRYLRGARSGELAVTEQELLSPETRLVERIMLGLRLANGVDLAQAGKDLGIEALTTARERAISRLMANGKVGFDGARVVVKPSARAVTDGIAAEII
jgi:coproporphyrinogen III oxidase-like Fe-S oxidoreductase